MEFFLGGGELKIVEHGLDVSRAPIYHGKFESAISMELLQWTRILALPLAFQASRESPEHRTAQPGS